jgi:asparagine synthase (glutamine-hydrolysing)
VCGIVGIVAPPTSSLDVRALIDATTALRHRGPDDEGYLLVDSTYRRVAIGSGSDTDSRLDLPPAISFMGGSWSVGFGHRRLSILDLSPSGHQPMASPDGACWITFNGEIYNFIELRDELLTRGARFRTGSDTEVLLAAYREWGDAMLPRLVGMFAFAIVDIANRRVVIARDQLGIKPLYYARTPSGFFFFASELKALLKFPGISRDVDAGELYRYLRFGFTDGTDGTFFHGIRQLPAAHLLSFPIDRLGDGTLTAYWRIREIRSTDISYGDAAIELQHRLRESVRLHMRSDVPVGACLSGGVDSSMIVRLMRDELGPAGDLHTFSYIAADPRVSEAKYVDMMAQRVGARSHLVSPQPDELARDFDDLILTQDQPFDGTSIYAQYRVFQLAHEAGIKVMLDGQGSDELFGGYNTAISAQLAALLSARRILDAARLWRAGDFVSEGARSRILLSALGRLLPTSLAAAIMPFFGESLTPEWMSTPYFLERGVQTGRRPQGRGRQALREELVYFTESLSLPRLLRFEDRNSMRFSIESRVPFCSTAIAELAMSLPQDYLISGDGRTKAILRTAVEGIVPTEILERPKIGFTTPERQWLGQLRPWITQQLDSQFARTAPFLEHEAIGRLISAQLDARGTLFRPSLWRVLNVLRWAELVDAKFV